MARTVIESGPFPVDDGWRFVYRGYRRWIQPRPFLRSLVCGYFWPYKWEQAGYGAFYRLFGVHIFGRMLPTGGITIRRLTGARMPAYTLRDISLGAARDFYYKLCIFETCHLPFMLVLLGLSVKWLVLGRWDLAAQDFLVNAAFNIWPVMHHRYTRVRICRLLGVL